MTDLTQNINRLKRYYVSKESLIDKDLQKENVFREYSTRVTTFFLAPLSLQVYQLLLLNRPESSATYHRIAKFKWFSLLAATGFGIWELFNLDKKWTYINRVYPEPTPYQKSLQKEAELFKLRDERPKDFTKKKSLGVDESLTYAQMYRLSPHTSAAPPIDHIPTDLKQNDE